MFYNFFKVFCRQKGNKYAVAVLLAVLFVSIFANFIANDKPIFLKYKGSYYFPVLFEYNETLFGGKLNIAADYREHDIQQEVNDNGYMIWPLIRYNYDTICYENATTFPAPPTSDNILGIDDNGYDVLSRIIYGIRVSLFFAFMLTCISTFIGMVIGSIQGYFGGISDIILQRFTEIWNSLPGFFVIVILSGMFKQGFWSLLLIMSLFSWIDLSMLIRSEVLKVKNSDYIMFAKTIGGGGFYILIKHVIPNALTVVISYTPFLFLYSIIALTSLDFLGVGLSMGSPSLGDLLGQVKSNPGSWWLGVAGCVAVIMILMPLIFISDALQRAIVPGDGDLLD